MRKLFRKGMAFALHLVHLCIANLWIAPLERLIIPRLTRREQSRFYKFLLQLVEWFVNVGRVIIMDLRLTVKYWTGPAWSVIYIGEGDSAEAIKYYLFQSPPLEKELPRVFLWQVPALIRKFTREGNLVVCEVNRIIRFSKKEADIFFIIPQWITQILEETYRPLSDILVDMNQNIRRNIRRLEAQDFSYEFTKDPGDFDLFYNRMYLPYIKLRHAKRSVLRDYNDLYGRFKYGGLILVRQNQTPVCGMLCLMKGDLCEAGQMGVLDGKFDLVKKGSNVALWWFMLDWARQQGAVRFDFGPSRPFMADGVFNFKRQWGTRVNYSYADTQWSFYSMDLPFELRQHLNQVGLISVEDGKGYRVILSDPDVTLGQEDFITQLNEADSCGLAGIMLIPGADKVHVARPI